VETDELVDLEKADYMQDNIRKNPICLFVKISYKLVPISKGQADFDLSLNNKLKLVSLNGWQADFDLFL
jgi:hypothetical protein